METLSREMGADEVSGLSALSEVARDQGSGQSVIDMLCVGENGGVEGQRKVKGCRVIIIEILRKLGQELR